MTRRPDNEPGSPAQLSGRGRGLDRLPDEPVEMEITDVLDLHFFRPAEIGNLVEDYLRLAWDKGLRRVRLIHGKGVGVQRRRVQTILESHPKVLSWGTMPPEAGGWGATWVELGEESP